MWRRNAGRFGNNAQEDEDSDQSISEEEEGLDSDWTGKKTSLNGGGNDKGSMQVLSQLEILRDSCEFYSAETVPVSSHGNLVVGRKKEVITYHIEDDVEIPIFNDVNGSGHYHRIASATGAHSNEGTIYLPTVASISHLDEEIISDDEKVNSPTFGTARENSVGTWHEASREVEALIWSNKNSSCSSAHGVYLKEKNSSRGGCSRKKAKTNFSFRSHSHTKDLPLVVSDSNGRASSESIPGAAADDDMENCMAESQQNFHDKESEQRENRIVPFEPAHEHDFKEHSMTDFLDCFIERNDLLQGSSELDLQKRIRREQVVLKRNTSPSSACFLDDNDLSDALDSGSPSQSEDEENAPSIKSIIPGRTMADQFHEAFGTVSVTNDRLNVAFPRPLCSGIYKKLQQVIQGEKERDTDTLKNISAETGFKSKDEGTSILVRILSRSLEAKLIVCSCTSLGDGKNSYWENNLDMKMKGVASTLTIIFNPRMCSDVDLEVGNLICIHPPWKEVQVKDEVIFLCSYFSQVQPRTNSNKVLFEVTPFQ